MSNHGPSAPPSPVPPPPPVHQFLTPAPRAGTGRHGQWVPDESDVSPEAIDHRARRGVRIALKAREDIGEPPNPEVEPPKPGSGLCLQVSLLRRDVRGLQDIVLAGEKKREQRAKFALWAGAIFVSVIIGLFATAVWKLAGRIRLVDDGVHPTEILVSRAP